MGTHPKWWRRPRTFSWSISMAQPCEKFAEKIGGLKKFGKPIVCNEDDKTGVLGRASRTPSASPTVPRGD